MDLFVIKLKQRSIKFIWCSRKLVNLMRLYSAAIMVSIPNALYVGGMNANWKPILNIDEVEEYKVSIYNRLGQLVYELEDYNQFWDGSYQSTGRTFFN